MKNGDYPANPTESVEDSGAPYYKKIPSKGLTKREAFAVAAMQGWLARCANVPHTITLSPESMSDVAVSMADALLKELEK